MEKAFTAHGKAGAFPHPVNAVSHSSIVRPVIHISTAPTTANIHPFFPAWIKENKSIKNREYSHHHASGNCTPFLCLEKWRKSTLFPILFSHSKAEGKSYCLCILSLTEPKNPLFSTLFPPLFCPICLVERTGNNSGSETLLAAMDTFSADFVVLPSAVLPKKEAPFLFPLFTSAHSSGPSFPGLPILGGFRSAHSFLAWESCPRTEGLSIPGSLSFARSPLLMIPSIIP